MAKTVKEMINNLLEKRKFHRCNECKIIDNEIHCINELKVYTGELQELKWAYENEIAEKDKEIALLKIRIINDNEGSCEMFEQGHKLQKEIEELKQQQLYKEDFIIGENHNCSIETYPEDNTFYTDDIKYVLIDNSKYDKLSGEEDK